MTLEICVPNPHDEVGKDRPQQYYMDRDIGYAMSVTATTHGLRESKQKCNKNKSINKTNAPYIRTIVCAIGLHQ